MAILQIIGGGAAAMALVAAGSLALPRHVSVSRSAHLEAAPERVLALAASTEGYQRFNPFRTADPGLKISPFGPAEGVGSGFRFEGKDGTGTQTIAAVTAETVTYRIDLGFFGQPVQTLSAAPEGDGARVTWRMEADMGMNPLLRVFGLFMDRMMGQTFETGLDNLNAAAA